MCVHLGSQRPMVQTRGDRMRISHKVWGIRCYDSTHFVSLAQRLSRRFPRLASYEVMDTDEPSGHYFVKVRVLGVHRTQFM